MCGIFGYIGDRNAEKVITEGLKRLEYRGYDSWGVAVKQDDKIYIHKTIGEIGDVEEAEHLPNSFVGIGHTRWATHGGVTQTNAHPHFSSDMSFVVAQNGIVENFQELKEVLISKGYKFNSQTDTEVIVRLIEEKLKGAGTLAEAVRLAFLDLKGRNTIIVLEQKKDHITAVRNGSPLVLGIGEKNGKKEFFLASDILSFANHTNKVVFLNDMNMIDIEGEDVALSDVRSGEGIDIFVKKVDEGAVEIDKEGYEHFMLKEIVEQQYTIREAANVQEADFTELITALKNAGTVYTVGAGTAAYAAGQIAYYLRKVGGIKAIELRSYEMGSYKDIMHKDDVMIAVSQSGETADTIEALEFAKKKGVKIASIVNMVGSTITRMSDYPFFTRSGPEICVASTKAFTAQVSWGYLLSMSLIGKYEEAKNEIAMLTSSLGHYFDEHLFEQIKAIADRLKDYEHFFVLGRDSNFYISLEGALKIKEITYKHFEGFAAGELKHGVIALIEKGTPVFSIVSNDDAKDDMISATAEVKARGAWTIGVGQVNSEFFDEYLEVPEAGAVSTLANVIPFQLTSYFLGLVLGNSIDKPRNLAKSVTVK